MASQVNLYELRLLLLENLIATLFYLHILCIITCPPFHSSQQVACIIGLDVISLSESTSTRV